jgi:hypothetical protein
MRAPAASNDAAILGPREFEAEVAMRGSASGVATDLARTSVGGDSDSFVRDTWDRRSMCALQHELCCGS